MSLLATSPSNVLPFRAPPTDARSLVAEPGQVLSFGRGESVAPSESIEPTDVDLRAARLCRTIGRFLMDHPEEIGMLERFTRLLTGARLDPNGPEVA
jgi:hypothetical protein